MANFHTNQFAIAANDEDMVKVLYTISFNLTTHGDIDVENAVTLSMDPVEAYQQVGGTIDACYWDMFMPKCFEGAGDEEELQLDNPALPPALAFARAANEAGLAVSFSVAPMGRPLSDTASVDLYRLGEVYVLTVYYSTAWVSNRDDFGELIDELPPGRYGISFIDADEGDWYADTTISYETVDKRPSSGPVGTGVFESMSAQELLEYAKPFWGRDASEESDLGRIAFTMNSYSWPHYGERDLEPGADSAGLDFEAWSWSVGRLSNEMDLEPLGCGELTDKEMGRVRDSVISHLAAMPQYFMTLDSHAERLERLVPLDELVLKTDWESSYFQPVAIEVLNRAGESLGNLCVFELSRTQPGVTEAALACLVPHLRAYAYEVSPSSMRISDTSEPRMAVAVEAMPMDLDEVFAEMELLFSQPASERTRTSVLLGGE